jgi:hypothetical protein
VPYIIRNDSLTPKRFYVTAFSVGGTTPYEGQATVFPTATAVADFMQGHQVERSQGWRVVPVKVDREK